MLCAKAQRLEFRMRKIIAALLIVTTLLVPFTGNQGYLGQETAIASAATNNIRDKAPKLSAVKRTATTVNLSYTKVKGADGYKVYRSDKVNGTYEYVGSSKGLTFTDKGLKYDKSYYYRVRAYVKDKDGKIHSKYSNKLQIYTTFSKIYLNIKGAEEDSLILSWNKIQGASKYKIYRADSKNGTYEYMGITTDTYYIDEDLDAGNSYYYRVRAYKKVDKVKYNGVYSDKVEGTVPSVLFEKKVSEKSDYAQQVLVLVNKERVKAGLSELSLSDTLTAPAQKRAVEIKDVFSHTRPDGRSWSSVLSDYNISYRASGENLAYGYNTPEAVVTGWMNSPGHRANILSANFNQIGIGVYTDSRGTVYCSQLFTN